MHATMGLWRRSVAMGMDSRWDEVGPVAVVAYQERGPRASAWQQHEDHC